MANHPKVSFVVVNFKGVHLLSKCLESIFGLNYPKLEVIVVDSLTNSEDLDAIKIAYPQVEFIHFEVDPGAAEAHNVGARLASSDSKYLVFMDNDIELDPNFLDPLVKLMQKDPSCGQAQGKIYFGKSAVFDSLGHLMGRHGYAANIGAGAVDRGQFEEIREISSARGACFIARKDAYFKAGGYDGSFFIYVDDIDFGWRVWLAGYRVMYTPRSISYHLSSATVNRLSPKLVFHRTKNFIAMLIKNYSFSKGVRPMVELLITDVGSVFRNFTKKRLDIGFAKLRALLKILTSFRSIYSERLKTQRCIRKIPDKTILSRIMFVNKGLSIDKIKKALS